MRPDMRQIRRWSALAIVPLLAGAAFLAGCGDRHLILSVDVLSFFGPNQAQIAIEPNLPPTPPPGVWIPEGTFPKLVDDQSIQLFSGADNVADVKSVTVHMTVIAVDSSGAGADTLRFYMSGPSQAPFPGNPIMTIPLKFTPPVLPAMVSIDTADVEVEQPTTVGQLVTGNRVRVTVTNSVRGPAGTPGIDPPLAGRIQMTRIVVTVIAGRKSL
jgi:hypothetical protein